ncbi:MAG: glycoside hydrolase family 97 protein [Candidatus Krumholzibacteriota bacterium]|nr:glycoside hydrolase family 97 protein [Candidatus Krumholzibacteriota bacterium]
MRQRRRSWRSSGGTAILALPTADPEDAVPTLAKLALLALPLLACLVLPAAAAELRAVSPDGRLELRFTIAEGVPRYALARDGAPLLLPSRLGFVMDDGSRLDRSLALVDSARAAVDETWEQPWGEQRLVRDRCRELRVTLAERSGARRRLVVVFRLFDDGLGLRYELPAQPGLRDFAIRDEVTEFVLAGDPWAWWIPAYHPERYEYLYRRTRLSGAFRGRVRALHTPLTLETAGGPVLCLHEAALTDWASMTLAPRAGGGLRCDLVPWSDGIRVRGETPHRSPWRVLIVADDPGGLVTSTLVLSLNEPCRLADTSWLGTGKYVGIWWGMHIGRYTWGSGPRHGATTENVKRTIDFAAAHGLAGVLVEGWNRGWDGDWAGGRGDFRFTEPHPDFDAEALAAYAAERGVALVGHHETGADVAGYEAQVEDAFAWCRRHGIRVVKTGYVSWGRGVPRIAEDGSIHNEWHHGQWMVRHYRRVVEAAARHGIMLDVHEPIKDTGIRRTWPNMMTREGARGQEWNAWGPAGGNPPEHETVLPFTRLVAGPMDFTPGIFDLLFADAKPSNRVNTTLAKQLALYVVIYSPWQMAADLPEHYADQPAFRFIEDVPADWEETRVLHGLIGEYVTIVRRERGGEDWFLGSVTDEAGRVLEADLGFLDPGRDYVAEIYADAPDADWRSNPLAIDIREVLVDSATRLRLRLAPGGGQAIRFRPARARPEP